MPAHTRTADQILNDRRIIAQRYLRGDYQADIARDLGISRQQVGYDLNAIRTQWQTEMIADFGAKQAQELAKIDEVEREYWRAWERSQEDKEISYHEVGIKGTRTGTRSEGQAGNPAFLAGVLSCIERRCAILGLDAPKRFTINWEELTPEQEERLARGEPPEKVLAA